MTVRVTLTFSDDEEGVHFADMARREHGVLVCPNSENCEYEELWPDLRSVEEVTIG